MDALPDTEKRFFTRPGEPGPMKLCKVKDTKGLPGRLRMKGTRRLLAEISADELKDYEFWSRKLYELGGESGLPLPSPPQIRML